MTWRRLAILSVGALSLMLVAGTVVELGQTPVHDHSDDPNGGGLGDLPSLVVTGNTDLGDDPADTLSIAASIDTDLIFATPGTTRRITLVQAAIDTAGDTLQTQGAQGGNASASAGGTGGPNRVHGGVGGPGTGSLNAGSGGAVTVQAGDAGADVGGGGASGANLLLNAGLGTGAFSDGSITVGSVQTATLVLGNSSNNTTITQAGTGQVYLRGLVGIGAAVPTFPLDIASTGTSMQQTRWSNNAGSGAGIVIQRSRGAAVDADTVVVDGDKLASLNFRGFDSSTFSSAATIQAMVDGAPGVGDMPGRLVFSTSADGSNTPTERMRIDSTGNVGIGAVSPGQTLTVDGTLGILETGASPSFHTILQGGDQAGDVTWTLPTAQGAASAVLVNDGAGVLSWTTIANANVGASAAIDYSKLATLTSGNLLVGDVSNIATAVAMTGDVAITDAGVTTVTDLTIASEVQGDVLYFNGSGWVRLAPGTTGQFLTANGAAANPSWTTAGGGADQVITCLPGCGSLAAATLTYDTTIGAHISFTNNGNQIWYAVFKVPSGATSISSVNVFYSRLSTGNLYLQFWGYHTSTDTTVTVEQDETDAATTYAGGGTGGEIESVTVPAGAYDGLTSLQADDLITFRVYRNGADASDTYETAWQVMGVEFTFN